MACLPSSTYACIAASTASLVYFSSRAFAPSAVVRPMASSSRLHPWCDLDGLPRCTTVSSCPPYDSCTAPQHACRWDLQWMSWEIYLWTSASGISGAPPGFDGSDTAKKRLRAWLGAPDANTSGTDPPRSVCSTSSVFAYKHHGTVKGAFKLSTDSHKPACRPQKAALHQGVLTRRYRSREGSRFWRLAWGE